MRTGLFLGALLATTLISGVALADRNSDDSNQKTVSRGQDIKERVLEKQREGFGKTSKGDAGYRVGAKQDSTKAERVRPHGEIYGDQATRGGKSAASSRGKNLSASNSVNNPSEIAAMKKLINPLSGAYRVSEASENADSYGGDSKMKSGSGSSAKNLSATGSVNNPSEIKAMLSMVAPMKGAYSTCAAAEGTDSYTRNPGVTNPFAQSKGMTSVHFKNDKGELIGKTTGDNKSAARSSAMRERLNKAIGEKMSHKTTTVEKDPSLKAATTKTSN